MGKLNINNGGVDTNKKMPDIDERFGPYTSIEAANAALGGQGRNTITAGLTVGILTANAGVKEYWYQPNKKSGILELIPKGGNAADNPTEGNFASFDENGNVVDSGNKATDFAPMEQAVPMGDEDDEGKILEKQKNGFGWVEKPVDGDDAYHVWLEANGYTEAEHPVSEYNEYNRGKSAREIYNATYNKNLNDAEFAAELKMNYPMLHVGYDSTNAGATIGVPFSGNLDPNGDNIGASDTTMGKLYLMPDAASDPENCIGFVTVLDGSTYKWCNVGAIRIPSDVLAKTDVDNECVDGATDEPASAKAVMQLKAKLEGVTANETKGVVTTVNGKCVYASGTNNPIGSIQSATNSILAIIDITGYDQIRVLMRYVVGTNIASGAAFYDENLNLSTFSNAESSKLYTLPWRTGADEATTEELVLKIPFGAKYFITSLQTSGVYTTQKFYAYLKKGDSLSDVLADLKFTDSLDVSGLQIDKKECSMTSGYVKDNGDIGVGTSSMIATVVLNGEQRVAFSAIYKSQNGDIGYAFYDGNLNVIEAHPYPIGDTTLSTEINADIPTNAAYLKFTVYYTIRNNYYCYLLSGNTDAEEANNSIGDISYNEILAAPTIQAGYYVRGTSGEVMHHNKANTSIFNIPDGAKYVRFLGEDKVSTGVASGYFFYKIEGVDTEIPIGGNTFRQGIVASTAVMEYVVEIPKGATIFKTTSNSIALLQSDFYCYFGFGTNIKDYINSIEHVSLTPILPSMEEFAYYMQRKSENIGMTNSEWHNPYGGRLYGFNYTTVKDLLYMTVFAASNPTLMRLMGSDSVKIQIVGKNEGVRTVTNDMRQQINTQYAALHSGATCPYRIIANKAGAHTNEDGSGVVSIKNGFALVLIAEIEGKLVAAVTGIGNTSLGYTEGRLRRVKGMVELLDICAASIRGESVTGMSVTFCEKAIACILPTYPSTCANYELPLIYQQDANTMFMPASVSKVMAAIAMIDILPLNDYYEILGNPDELVNDSDYTAYAGDIQTVEDSMYAMLMASNGANTLSLARLAGEHLLHNKNIILSNQ